MEKFSLEKYLENPQRKVVTRDGRPVRIVCWNLKCNTPIIVAIQWNQEREDCYCYDTIGRCANNVGELDLFFADEEEELTEFEKEFEMMMVSFSNGNLGSDVIKEMPKQKLHNYACRLLDLARKELIEELSDDNFAIDFALNKGKQDALKDLPKWKKCVGSTGPFIDYNSKGEEYLYLNDYVIKVSELFEKLPKEE